MPPQNQNQRDEGLRDELRAIGQSLNTNGRDIAARLDEIDRKQQAQSTAFQNAMTDLRRELMSLFVAKAEYEPKHTILQDRINKLEAVHDASQSLIQDFITVKNKVEQHSVDIEELDKHNAGTGQRVMGVGAVVISLIGLIITILQHVHIQ